MLIQDKVESAGGATRWVILRKIAIAHVITSMENVAKTKQTKEDTLNRDSSRFRGNTRGKPKHGRMARNPRGQRDVRQVTEQTMDESRGNRMISICSAQEAEKHKTL